MKLRTLFWKSKAKYVLNSDVESNLVILFIKGFSEKIRRIVDKYDVRTPFDSCKSIDSILCKPKLKFNKLDTEDVVYIISSVYVG